LAIEYVKNGDFQPAKRSMAMQTVCSGSISVEKNKRGAWGAKPPILGMKKYYDTVWYSIVWYGFYGIIRYGMVGIVW
jgi:hypothetical protein